LLHFFNIFFNYNYNLRTSSPEVTEASLEHVIQHLSLYAHSDITSIHINAFGALLCGLLSTITSLQSQSPSFRRLGRRSYRKLIGALEHLTGEQCSAQCHWQNEWDPRLLLVSIIAVPYSSNTEEEKLLLVKTLVNTYKVLREEKRPVHVSSRVTRRILKLCTHDVSFVTAFVEHNLLKEMRVVYGSVNKNSEAYVELLVCFVFAGKTLCQCSTGKSNNSNNSPSKFNLKTLPSHLAWSDYSVYSLGELLNVYSESQSIITKCHVVDLLAVKFLEDPLCFWSLRAKVNIAITEFLFADFPLFTYQLKKHSLNFLEKLCISRGLLFNKRYFKTTLHTKNSSENLVSAEFSLQAEFRMVAAWLRETTLTSAECIILLAAILRMADTHQVTIKELLSAGVFYILFAR
jgi:hypothetical protein